MVQVDPRERFYDRRKKFGRYFFTATAFFNYASDASTWLIREKQNNKKLRGYLYSYHYNDVRLKSLFVVYTRKIK